MMNAAIYTLDGAELCAGLQPSSVSSAAYRAAANHASRLNSVVHLVDDDGEWLVWPDGTCERYSDARAAEAQQ